MKKGNRGKQKILVVCYSFSNGNTRKIAWQLQSALGAYFAPSMEVQFDSQGGANMQTSQAQIDEWITRVKAWV